MNRRQFQQIIASAGAGMFLQTRAHAASGEAFPVADALVHRLLGVAAGDIRCEKAHVDSQTDCYTIDKDGDTLVLRGNSPVAIASALNDWMRHDAKRQLSWTGANLTLPDVLPLADKPRSAKASLPHRVAYNFCTFGYTMAWWDWEQWERELDFLALMGVNMPLAMVGHECVWRNVFTSMGMSDEAIRSFLCGPSFLPWQFMANIESWGGPMPVSWLESHEELGKKIWDRMRELGMTPIAPGFTGYVPVALKEMKPESKIFIKRGWYGFSGTAQLDPSDPLFAEITGRFVKEQKKLFGDAQWYACDVFHESEPPTDDPAYLASVGKTLINSLTKAAPKAKIAMQTWSLYEHIVKAIPKDQLLLLDLDGRRKDYWGYPFVSGVIHNFGGRVYLGGSLNKSLDFDRHAVREDLNNCQGLGVFCEGSYANSPIYMAALEGVFRAPGAAKEPKVWMKTWAQSRFGVDDGPAIDAWVSTIDHVYANGSAASYQSGETAFCMRPTLSGGSSSPSAGSFSRSYALLDLWAAWSLLASDSPRLGKLETYRYDLVDWGRQALADLAVALHREMKLAYDKGEKSDFEKSAAIFMELGHDLNRLLGTLSVFRLGKWLEEARRWGKTDAEKTLLEQSARLHVTMWGPNSQAQVNFDYSNRQWHGLLESFYLKRWEGFITLLKGEFSKPADERFDDSKMRSVYGRPGVENHPFYKKLGDWEWQWSQKCEGRFTAGPEGDPIAISKELLGKYGSLVKEISAPSRMLNLPDDSYELGEWRKDMLKSSWEIRQWPLEGKLSDSGVFKVTFMYASGVHRLRAKNVKLLHNGKVVSSDKHEGSSGHEHENNVWTLEFPKVTQAAGLVLEAEVKTDGGTDSNGVIYAER